MARGMVNSLKQGIKMNKIFVLALSLLISSPVMASQSNHRKYHHHHHINNGSYHNLATQIALKYGVSPAVVHAIIIIESGGRCGADNGIAHGIMQVQTPTAHSVGVHGNLHNCLNGIEAGVRYLKKAIIAHGNNCVGFSSYNSGIGTHKCTSYGRKVMRLAGR